jgi:hypothetical protein
MPVAFSADVTLIARRVTDKASRADYKLAAADAGRAFTAIARLADAPVETVAMLRRRLHPAKAP